MVTVHEAMVHDYRASRCKKHSTGRANAKVRDDQRCQLRAVGRI
jgi:hypothetical protein